MTGRGIAIGMANRAGREADRDRFELAAATRFANARQERGTATGRAAERAEARRRDRDERSRERVRVLLRNL